MHRNKGAEIEGDSSINSQCQHESSMGVLQCGTRMPIDDIPFRGACTFLVSDARNRTRLKPMIAFGGCVDTHQCISV